MNILTISATSYERSQVHPLLPLVRALPEKHYGMLPYVIPPLLGRLLLELIRVFSNLISCIYVTLGFLFLHVFSFSYANIFFSGDFVKVAMVQIDGNGVNDLSSLWKFLYNLSLLSVRLTFMISYFFSSCHCFSFHFC